jgi:hypothetical protein
VDLLDSLDPAAEMVGEKTAQSGGHNSSDGDGSTQGSGLAIQGQEGSDIGGFVSGADDVAAVGQGGGHGPAVAGWQGQNGYVDAGHVSGPTATNLDPVAPLTDQGLDPAWIAVHDHYAIKGGIVYENAPGPPADRSHTHQRSFHRPTGSIELVHR